MRGHNNNDNNKIMLIIMIIIMITTITIIMRTIIRITIITAIVGTAQTARLQKKMGVRLTESMPRAVKSSESCQQHVLCVSASEVLVESSASDVRFKAGPYDCQCRSLCPGLDRHGRSYTPSVLWRVKRAEAASFFQGAVAWKARFVNI